MASSDLIKVKKLQLQKQLREKEKEKKSEWTPTLNVHAATCWDNNIILTSTVYMLTPLCGHKCLSIRLFFLNTFYSGEAHVDFTYYDANNLTHQTYISFEVVCFYPLCIFYTKRQHLLVSMFVPTHIFTVKRNDETANRSAVYSTFGICHWLNTLYCNIY